MGQGTGICYIFSRNIEHLILWLAKSTPALQFCELEIIPSCGYFIFFQLLLRHTVPHLRLAISRTGLCILYCRGHRPVTYIWLTLSVLFELQPDRVCPYFKEHNNLVNQAGLGFIAIDTVSSSSILRVNSPYVLLNPSIPSLVASLSNMSTWLLWVLEFV